MSMPIAYKQDIYVYIDSRHKSSDWRSNPETNCDLVVNTTFLDNTAFCLTYKIVLVFVVIEADRHNKIYVRVQDHANAIQNNVVVRALPAGIYNTISLETL